MPVCRTLPDTQLPGAAEYPTVKEEPVEVKQEIKEEPIDDDYEDATGYEKYDEVKDEPIADVSVLRIYNICLEKSWIPLLRNNEK